MPVLFFYLMHPQEYTAAAMQLVAHLTDSLKEMLDVIEDLTVVYAHRHYKAIYIIATA